MERKLGGTAQEYPVELGLSENPKEKEVEGLTCKRYRKTHKEEKKRFMLVEL